MEIFQSLHEKRQRRKQRRKAQITLSSIPFLNTMAKKVVLGFSGGLDTSYCVKYLTEDLGYEVHSIIVNTGGFTEEELKNIL